MLKVDKGVNASPKSNELVRYLKEIIRLEEIVMLYETIALAACAPLRTQTLLFGESFTPLCLVRG